MIPVSLHLTNFLSYRGMPEPLDFRGITLACLSGPNGHGKSSLLDAMTWVLWGKARGATGGHDQERLISDGAEAARVELVFSLDGQVYRVARERWRSGKSSLQLEVAAPGGGWTDLAGEGILDTQRRIDERLRMEYETFVASAFILQGRADTFTTLDPAKRKEILGKILGIEIYERFAERAKDRKKECTAGVSGLEGQLSGLESDLDQVPVYEEQRERAREELTTTAAEREAAESAHTTAQEALARIRALEAAAEHVRRRADEAARDADAARGELERLEERITELDRRAAVAEADARAAAALPERRSRLAELEGARRHHEELRAEAASLAGRIGEERARLSARAKGLEQRIAEGARDLAAEPEARKRLAEARERLAELEQLASRREALVEEHSAGRARLEGLKASARARAGQLEEIDEKLGLLKGARSGCPLCGEPLTPEHRREIVAGFRARRKELAAQTAADETEAGRLTARLKAVEREVAGLGRQLDGRGALATRVGTFAEALEALARRDAEVAGLSAEREELSGLLAREDFAPAEREKLAAVEADLGTTGFEPEAYERARRTLDEALDADRRVAGALRARAALEEAAAARTSLGERLASSQEAFRAASEDVGRIESDLAGREAVVAGATAAKERLDAVIDRERKGGEALAVAEERLAELKGKAERAAAVRKALTDVRKRGRLYDKLAKAFGRDGIPARIIGNAIPELQIEANRLLDLLSDGRMSLSIDPVRRAKSGREREALDITVYDGGEKRFYEMYSGGERLRIDVALRVALSRLLTHRAGARLETLVIDEGFGTQDDEGRARLVEAILKIRGDFGLILVISHLEEIKEQFPTRIEVSKDVLAGSRAVVV